MTEITEASRIQKRILELQKQRHRAFEVKWKLGKDTKYTRNGKHLYKDPFGVLRSETDKDDPRGRAAKAIKILEGQIEELQLQLMRLQYDSTIERLDEIEKFVKGDD